MVNCRFVTKRRNEKSRFFEELKQRQIHHKFYFFYLISFKYKIASSSFIVGRPSPTHAQVLFIQLLIVSLQ